MYPRPLLLLFILFAAAHTPTAGAVVDGARLFARHCAACHGQGGQGGVGVPLANRDFLAVADDAYLTKTIRAGRPGRVMPAFANLRDEEVRAIVGHIRTWGSVQPAHERAAPVSGDAARGETLYAVHCAECHGISGEGGHGTGVTFSRPRNLPVMAPALNNPGFLGAASDAMIKATLRRGREGTPMVSFLERGLSERDIDDVVAYVRSFERNPIEWRHAPDELPYLEYESPYGMEETLAALERATVGKNFRVIREQRLEDGLFAEHEQRDDAHIVFFCNFQLINEALSVDPRVGLFMPCRVTAVERDGVVSLLAVNPLYMSRFFNNRELDEACARMYDLYVAILEEATL